MARDIMFRYYLNKNGFKLKFLKFNLKPFL